MNDAAVEPWGPESRTDLLASAEAAARAAAVPLLGYFSQSEAGRARLGVEHKAKNDLVSRADREAEQAIVATLADRHPGHRVVGEEGGARGPAAGAEAPYEWIVDPLDGTTNFVQGLPIWCVSIACRYRRRLVAAVVYDPLRDHLFSAASGLGTTWNGESARVSRTADAGAAVLATGFPFRAHPALDAYLEAFRDVFFRVRAIRRCGAAALDLAYTAAGIYDGFFELRLAPWDVAAGSLLIEEAGGRVTDLDGKRGFLLSGNVIAGSPAIQPRLLEWVGAHVSEARVAREVPVDVPAIEPLPED